ncbi:MAG: glycosyltransferase family 4 protein [Bacteroidales bacterium]|nr:glycosyltransferase family 4 protein [Bacteroidales bacterium]
MKIAYISSAFLTDSELPLIQEMTRQGADVCYFLQMSDSSRQATIINVQAMKPKGGVYPATAFPDLASLSEFIPLDKVFVVNMPRPKDLHWQSLRAVWALYRMLRSQKFDVIHVTSPLRYGSFLLYLLRRRMVLTMHDPLPHSSDRNRLNRLQRWMAFQCVSRFIVLSASLRDEFIQTYHLQKKQVFVSRMGVFSHLQHTVGVPMNLPARYMLFTGSINPHKGIRYLCEALSLLKEPLPLVIAGRGQFDFDIQPYLAAGNIHLINRFVTNEELYTLIKGSLFVCCPYKDATQSGVVLSAFALSKPVLATRVGALPEEIEEGRHGLLVEPCDAKALAQGIEAILQPGRLEAMSAAIQEDFSIGNRSWSHIAAETLKIYQTVTR